MRLTGRKNGFYIGVTCPGCGAGLELQENFFVVTCAHCGSTLRVVMPDTPPAFMIAAKKTRREIRFRIDRHLKENGLPLTRSDFSLHKIYYPYWKVDAIQLKISEPAPAHASESVNILTAGITGADMMQFGGAVRACLNHSRSAPRQPENEMSVTLTPFTCTRAAGPETAGIPFSVGMRADYVKMVPFAAEHPDMECDCRPVVRSWSDVVGRLTSSPVGATVENTDGGMGDRKLLLRFTGTVIYFPFFICHSGGRRYVADGVSGRVLDSVPEKHDDLPGAASAAPEFACLSVEFHRCPTCGADLPPSQSYVYICRNCHAVVSLDRDVRLTPQIFWTEDNRGGDDPLFPFWTFRLPSETVGMIAKSSYHASPPDRLVVPAFRIANFGVMRRLCQRITAAYSHFPRERVESFQNLFRPVDLSFSEAKTMAEICLFCERVRRNPRVSLESVTIRPHEVSLFYAPFHPQSYFYVDSVINTVTFAKNAVIV